MVQACHTLRQLLQNHASGHLGGWAKLWSAEGCWVDNIKEWASLPMPELLTRASCKKDWKRISAESSLMPPPPTGGRGGGKGKIMRSRNNSFHCEVGQQWSQVRGSLKWKYERTSFRKSGFKTQMLLGQGSVYVGIQRKKFQKKSGLKRDASLSRVYLCRNMKGKVSEKVVSKEKRSFIWGFFSAEIWSGFCWAVLNVKTS